MVDFVLGQVLQDQPVCLRSGFGHCLANEMRELLLGILLDTLVLHVQGVLKTRLPPG